MILAYLFMLSLGFREKKVGGRERTFATVAALDHTAMPPANSARKTVPVFKPDIYRLVELLVFLAGREREHASLSFLCCAWGVVARACVWKQSLRSRQECERERCCPARGQLFSGSSSSSN